MTLCVKVEDVAAALSRAVHTRATMPDYTVSRVAYEGDDEVMLITCLWLSLMCLPGIYDSRESVREQG